MPYISATSELPASRKALSTQACPEPDTGELSSQSSSSTSVLYACWRAMRRGVGKMGRDARPGAEAGALLSGEVRCLRRRVSYDGPRTMRPFQA